MSALQRPHPHLLKHPTPEDLYSIELPADDTWYRIGTQLGLESPTLDSIKAMHSKPRLCKRAMFRTWLNECPVDKCTWQRLISAIESVDSTVAQYLFNYVIDSDLDTSKSHTVQLPLQIQTTAGAPQKSPGTPTDSGVQEIEKSRISQTEVVESKLSLASTSVVATKGQSGVEGGKSQDRMEADYDSASLSVEVHRESEHAIRSFSVEAECYETASEKAEDDSFKVFKYQHDGEDDPSEAGSISDREREQIITTALKTDNVTTIKMFIEKKELTSKTKFRHERTVLMCAALHGAKIVIAYLLKVEGMNSLLEVDEEGAMPLYFAVSEGFYEAAKLLVARHVQLGVGLDLSVKGTPIIMFPASKGFSMICELLLENRANPNRKDTNGETALHFAAHGGHKDVAKVLLRFKADVSIASRKTSMTPLECAMEGRHVETVQILAEASLRSKHENLKLFSCKTREEIGQLIKAGAKVNFRGVNETTSLMTHALNGTLDLVQELLDHHANVDLQDEEGESALMKASYRGHVKVVDTLIEHEAILDLKTTKGHTALALSILHQQPPVVSRLVIAGANTGIKDKNGHSIEKLAVHTDNQEIIEILNRSHNVVRHEAPFIDVLSDYFQKKVDEDKTKRDTKEHRKKIAKEELMRKMPRPPRSIAGDDSSTKKELKKAYERISALEIRVHDLTLQVTSETPSEEDITFLERNRLEAEFIKLKEAKLKAEKYAIEAKQTSLRLSAENAKLKEDLTKERRYNELTRDSIMHDIEKVVEETERLEEKTQAKLKAFEQEVATRASQLARSISLEEAGPGTFDFSHKQLKEVILQHSLRMSLSSLIVGGLPCSGKTTLLHSMLQLKPAPDVCSLPESGLTVMEAAVMRNPFSKKQLQWLSAIAKDDAELLMLAVCLAQICAKRNQSLKFLSTEESKKCIEEVFESPRLNDYVSKTFSRLVNLIAKLEREDTSLQCLQHASLVFMNIWDVGVNRAVCNAMLLLARRCKNLVLVNVLDLKNDAEHLDKPLNLQNRSRYEGRYSVRKDDMNSMQIHKAGMYYARFVEFSNQVPNSSLLVGTHKDAFVSGEEKQEMVKLSALVKHSLQQKFAGTPFSEALCPQVLMVDARSEADAEKVRITVEEMICEGDRMEATVPLNWIMLRGILHAAKHLFLTKSELWSYASECGLQNLEELEAWLHLFQSCMSVIYCADNSIPSLHSNVIIHPFKFIECLDCLYYAQLNKDLLADKFLSEHMNLLSKGLLTYTLAERIWADKVDRTASDKNTTCNFILRVLKDLRISTKVEMSIEPSLPADEVYFIPSLRPYLRHRGFSNVSDPLMVYASRIHQVPFDVCVEFLAFTQQQDTTKHLRFILEDRYNVLHLCHNEAESKLKADITFRVLNHEDMVEVNVNVEGRGRESSALREKICSILKTACIEFFHEISRRVSNMSYKFGIVSPTCSREAEGPVHFVPFDISVDQDIDGLICHCGKTISLSECSDQSRLWMMCAYQGSPHMLVSNKDVLSRHDLVNVADSLYHHSSDKISEVATALGISAADLLTLKQFCTPEDFPLLILLEWKKRHSVASRPKLASALLACGLQSLAEKLDPNVESASQKKSPVSLSTKELSILNQIAPFSKWQEIGIKLNIEAKDIQQLKDRSASTDALKMALHNWERKHRSKEEMLQTLVKALTGVGLNGIADSLMSSQRGDSDTGLLK